MQEYMSLAGGASHLDAVPELSADYDEYLDEDSLRRQINEGKLLVGRMGVNRINPQKASIRVFGLEEDVYIIGEKNINRATSFDTVAVRILPESGILERIYPGRGRVG